MAPRVMGVTQEVRVNFGAQMCYISGAAHPGEVIRPTDARRTVSGCVNASRTRLGRSMLGSAKPSRR
ncbi:MAG: hypothetical protein INR71_08615 [Terriglobus roseus]|nr:hypothetical protein [Terriglobus roseus]